MREPCEHAVYLPNGLVHTPMGTCDCDRTLNIAQERAERIAYVNGMMEAHHPGKPIFAVPIGEYAGWARVCTR